MARPTGAPEFFGRSEMPDRIAGVVVLEGYLPPNEFREKCEAISASLRGARTMPVRQCRPSKDSRSFGTT